MSRHGRQSRLRAGGRPLVLVLAASALSCGGQTVHAGPDADVYSAVLSHLFPNGLPPVVVVKDAAIPMPPLAGSSPDWLEREFAAVPVALRDAAEHPADRRGRFDPALFPPQVHLVPAGRIDSLWGDGVEEGWVAFRQTFEADRWQAFSHVLISRGREALVYCSWRGGGTRGEEAYLWLHRESRAGAWTVRKVMIVGVV